MKPGRPAWCGDGRRRSSASAGIPTDSSSAHHRARSCGCTRRTLPGGTPAPTRVRAAESDPPARFRASSAQVFCGPVPCRRTTTSGGADHATVVGSGRREQQVDAADAVDQRRERAVVASTSRCAGWAGTPPAGPAPRRAGRRSAARAVRGGWAAGRPPGGPSPAVNPFVPGASPGCGRIGSRCAQAVGCGAVPRPQSARPGHSSRTPSVAVAVAARGVLSDPVRAGVLTVDRLSRRARVIVRAVPGAAGAR